MKKLYQMSRRCIVHPGKVRGVEKEGRANRKGPSYRGISPGGGKVTDEKQKLPIRTPRKKKIEKANPGLKTPVSTTCTLQTCK